MTDDLRDLVGSGPTGFSDLLRRAGHVPPDLTGGGSVPELGEALLAGRVGVAQAKSWMTVLVR